MSCYMHKQILLLVFEARNLKFIWFGVNTVLVLVLVLVHVET